MKRLAQAVFPLPTEKKARPETIVISDSDDEEVHKMPSLEPVTTAPPKGADEDDEVTETEVEGLGSPSRQDVPRQFLKAVRKPQTAEQKEYRNWCTFFGWKGLTKMSVEDLKALCAQRNLLTGSKKRMIDLNTAWQKDTINHTKGKYAFDYKGTSSGASSSSQDLGNARFLAQQQADEDQAADLAAILAKEASDKAAADARVLAAIAEVNEAHAAQAEAEAAEEDDEDGESLHSEPLSEDSEPEEVDEEEAVELPSTPVSWQKCAGCLNQFTGKVLRITDDEVHFGEYCCHQCIVDHLVQKRWARNFGE